MWYKRLQTLDEILDFAEFYESKKSLNPTASTRRGLRVAEGEQEAESPSMKKLQEQLEQIQLALQEMRAERAQVAPATETLVKQTSRQADPVHYGHPPRRFKCWNCREFGHQRRDCSKERIGDGFTYRRVRRQRQVSTPVEETHLN